MVLEQTQTMCHKAFPQKRVLHWTFAMFSLLASFSFKTYIYLFTYWLHWVLTAKHWLSLVAVSGGYSSLQRVGFSLWQLLLAELRL